jgi:AraC-like DNA-binding protein
MLPQVIPKRELLRIIKRFVKDQNRGISVKLFAEVCGVNKEHLLDVFYYRTQPLTEYIQIRVSKGYKSWLKGEVAVMQNRNNSKFVEYRREPKPRLARSTGLHLVNGEIKIKIGISNKGDYSGLSLDEALERG